MPACMANAVAPLLGYQPDSVTLHRGSPFSFYQGSSVTIGNNIYLDSQVYDTMFTNRDSTWITFHEIGHTPQYAEGRLSILGAIWGYARVGFQHDKAWFEIEASRFADAALRNFDDAGGVAGCEP